MVLVEVVLVGRVQIRRCRTGRPCRRSRLFWDLGRGYLGLGRRVVLHSSDRGRRGSCSTPSRRGRVRIRDHGGNHGEHRRGFGRQSHGYRWEVVGCRGWDVAALRSTKGPANREGSQQPFRWSSVSWASSVLWAKDAFFGGELCDTMVVEEATSRLSVSLHKMTRVWSRGEGAGRHGEGCRPQMQETPSI